MWRLTGLNWRGTGGLRQEEFREAMGTAWLATRDRSEQCWEGPGEMDCAAGELFSLNSKTSGREI